MDEGSEPGVKQGSVSSVVLQIDRLLTFSLVSGSGVGAEWLEGHPVALESFGWITYDTQR